jgi:asparagine synthase (glutamine-hydrolysing)
MSILFGVRFTDGRAGDESQLIEMAHATERYAPDGTFVRSLDGLGMGFQAYHTHERSKLEAQPAIDAQGNMITFDGRLDNHKELSELLGILQRDTPDSLIALAAFLHWGDKCFSKLVGDWAIALWSAKDRVTHLARDHAGMRTLYFNVGNGTLRWATYLETFFVCGQRYPLDEQYARSFLCAESTGNITPYKGIVSVPPAHVLTFDDSHIRKTAHWNWIADSQVHYASDAEYEEHLFALFKQSVARRTGPGAPILAQLSGGMDSTSIVCMSDHIRHEQSIPASGLLDTISFYDRTEPSWDEEPYFAITEEKRGRVGVHIETSSSERTFMVPDRSVALYLFPGADSATVQRERVLEENLKARDYRVILSGIGGDELLGGVPTPVPELADYLFLGRFPSMFKQAMAWCMVTREPVLRLLLQTMRSAAYLYVPHRTIGRENPPWLGPRLMAQFYRPLFPCAVDTMTMGVRPSALTNAGSWWAALATLPHLNPDASTRREFRYPYLDRDLVDLLLRVPREQLVRPGRRRSLMRRAFKDLVPSAVLERGRKAFIDQGPIRSIQQAQHVLYALMENPILANSGLIDLSAFRHHLDFVTSGRDTREWPLIMRTLLFELWLKTLEGSHLMPQTARTTCDLASAHA